VKTIALPKKIFSPRAVLECGQVFRYKLTEEKKPPSTQRNAEEERWEIVSGNRRCFVAENDSEAFIHADKVDMPYFENYFDLETDYEKIVRKVRRAALGGEPAFDLRPALAHGKGLRILRQEPFETLVSFIVSTNNNIPRIRGILEKLCAALGELRGISPQRGGGQPFRAFPAPETMAAQDESFYRGIGAGYRAPWLLRAAQKVCAGTINLEELGALPTAGLLAALRQFDGIGPKAADCIALFAYRRFEVFPVDTWVKKIYADIFGADRASEKTMREKLAARFGECAGAAQQFLFYHYRQKAGASRALPES
jgi:N-glycosylase/DNA lyase